MMMSLTTYLSSLCTKSKDTRLKKNIELLVSKILESKHLRIYSSSKDKNEYDKLKGLISGKQVNTLSKEIILGCVKEKTLADLGSSNQQAFCMMVAIYANLMLLIWRSSFSFFKTKFGLGNYSSTRF